MTDFRVYPADPPMITPVGPVLNASALSPEVRWLYLDKKTIPEGELAKLPKLEKIMIYYSRNSELDLRGCENLREVHVNNCRALESIQGLDELPHLRVLQVTTCRNLREIPDLSAATELTDLHIGPFDVATTIAPALTAPNLEDLELRGAVPLAPGDVEAIRDHPTLAAFRWAAIKVPAKVSARVIEIVGRPSTRPEAPEIHAPDPVPLSDEGSIPLPAALELQVNCSTGTGWGGFYPVYLVGDIMLDGAPNFGSALTKIEIDLFPGQEARGDFAADIRRHNEFRQQLPEIRFRRSAGSVLIRAASQLDVRELDDRQESTAVPLFRQACEDILAALETLQQRLKSKDDFDLDGFLTFCRKVLDRIPSSQAELDALGEAATNRRRRARQAEASEAGFPGWMPGEPAPLG